MKTKTPHNQRIKRLWPIVAGAGLLFAGVGPAAAEECVDLLAGQTERVGDVCWDGTNKITYKITEPNWCLVDIHTDVVSDPDDFPTTGGGNPKLNEFKYHDSFERPPCITEWTQEITEEDMDSSCDGNKILYIAGHATLEMGDEGNPPLDLLGKTCPPAEVAPGSIIPTWHGGDSYFNVEVFGAKPLQTPVGNYDAWCIDPEQPIRVNDGSEYDCNFYSSHDKTDWPLNLVPLPGNMDLVNWAMNQSYVGKTSECSDDGGVTYTNFTFGDMQQAYWNMIDGVFEDHWTLLDWSECRVAQIEDEAWANGEGFIPADGDLHGIICDVVDADCNRIDVQTTMFEFRSFRTETAWGDGEPFGGKTWATYFEASCPVD